MSWQDYSIHPPTYDWSVRAFAVLRRVLRVDLELHDGLGRIDDGDIFLFNHFARFETFIPQYFIHVESGAYCRSIASGEFFGGDDAFSTYLRRVGAVPNDLPDLLPFLAAEVLRGRKVVVFPEGGMVKDRQVLDESGAYSVYSRTAQQRRVHHTGAAFLALGLDVFKSMVLDAQRLGHEARLESWAEGLGLEDVETLLAACRRPTRIVAANITFYPIRVRDNLLRRGAELFARGLSRRATEELLVEGNILLRDTDMDIRLGRPVDVSRYWRWWERQLLLRSCRKLPDLDAVFALRGGRGSRLQRLFAARLRRRASLARDDYMHRMYTGVTVNLSHLASALMLGLIERGVDRVPRERFHRLLYLAVKRAQKEVHVHLHRSLRDPQAYGSLLDGDCDGLEQLLRSASRARLVAIEDEHYVLLDKLKHEHDFDEIRLENPMLVYANEAAPIAGVKRALDAAFAEVDRVASAEIGRCRFDDHLIAHAFDRHQFGMPQHHDINSQQKMTEASEPFLMVPPRPVGPGVLLVHGFLASPAEMRGLGEKLHGLGYPVLGVRLRGHGTSPWDLRERSWEDWLDSVRAGYESLTAFAERVVMVGFSTGGGLALRHAADAPAGLAGLVAISVPMRFGHPGMKYVPLVHRANRLVSWVSGRDGLMPFTPSESEHPHINYAHMPVRGLFELRRLVAELEATLVRVRCPVSLIQGSHDPVVTPDSVERLRERLTEAEAVTVTLVESERHGIVYQDVGDTHAEVIAFLRRLEG